MKKIIECVPNFSEGKNQEVIMKIVKAISDVPGVFLLDQESDPAHNRSVITFAGEPSAVMEAAFRGVAKAAELIDMERHRGEHPRMGATDVLPLVPLKGVNEEECIKYALQLGERIGKELNIPVYLYEKAAQGPERENLADVRRGEYEGIKEDIEKLQSRKPDFGPAKMGKAGATAVGVRAPLVAYNVNLKNKDIKIARAIARKIRFKDGGLPCVKALGFELKDRGIVQVSMNLTDYKVTGVHTVFEAIKEECEKYGVEILESELIGLIPQEALSETAKHYLKINGFSSKQILENVLQEKMENFANSNNSTNSSSKNSNESKNHENLKTFLDDVASKNPVPGGGSVSALAGSLAAALCSMVANLTLTNKNYTKVHNKIAKVLEETEKLRTRLYELIEEDSLAYQAVANAYKNKEDKNSIQKALKEAAKTPLEIAQTAHELLTPLKTLENEGNKNAISDCGVAKHMIEAAIKGAILNVEINLKYIEDEEFVKNIKEKIYLINQSLK